MTANLRTRHPGSRGLANGDALFQIAVEAAEIGTWTWHIPSGRVIWTEGTYRLFGFQPGAFVTSYDAIICRVHADDRQMVLEESARSVRDRTRGRLEFRIYRADGRVRWVRCIGRTMRTDAQGRAVLKAGLIDDITEEVLSRRAAPRSASFAIGPFSLKQVACLLGIGVTSLKRLAEAGAIESFRSTRKDARRFTPEQVMHFLSGRAHEPADFERALRTEDMNGCLFYLIRQLRDGKSFEELLDEYIAPAYRVAPPRFAADLISRIPFIVPEPQRAFFPALIARVGAVEAWDSELIQCVLRAHGHEVLSPVESTGPEKLTDLVEQVRARFVVLMIGRAPAEVQSSGLSIATEIAARLPGGAMCVRCEETLRLPSGVTRIRSMRDLGSLLRQA
jgi:hypothetical protein